MDSKNLLFTWALLFGIALTLIAFIDLSTDYLDDRLCKDNGFDKYNSLIKVDKGYTACCNIIYENHLYIGEECKAIKRGQK
jgi:hypothetical protein